MRRGDVFRWLAEQVRDNRQGVILAGGAAWINRVVTREEIAEELGISPKTVQRDVSELIKEGFILKRKRSKGMQLGLPVPGQNVQAQPPHAWPKCPGTEPLYNSSSSSSLSDQDKTEVSGVDRGVRGEREERKRPLQSANRKMQNRQRKQPITWAELVKLAEHPGGWEDLEALGEFDRFGFAETCRERVAAFYPGRGEERINATRIMGIRTDLSSPKKITRTLWPAAAIVRALLIWDGKDQEGRWIQQTGSYLYRKAHFIATEELRKEWEKWKDADDRRRAEARGPEAADVQALIAGLAKAKKYR